MVLNTSKEPDASTFYPEDGGSLFIFNYGHHQLDLHGVII
jgi:hypothetical protein